MTADLMQRAAEAMAASRAQADPDYPVFHVTPPVGRLNDPNGLLIKDGTHHVFYQFSPFFPERGVFWGHASSVDLVHWTTHEPAIAPAEDYERDGAYSGNAFFHGDEIWLFYTGNVRPGEVTRASHQCLVTTRDLVHFTKYDGNPIIDSAPDGFTPHYRDPQVWQDADGSYRMAIGAKREGNIGAMVFLRSDDLLNWTYDGDLAFPDADGAFDHFGYMWECPNFVTMTDEVTGETKDVLIFSPQGIPRREFNFRNIFAVGYVVGRLDGTDFREVTDITELDCGFEYYAPQTFKRAPGDDGPLTYIAWIGNSATDDHPSLPDHGWIHCLSTPRVLTLHDGILRQQPVIGAGELTLDRLAVSGQTLTEATTALAELDGVRSFVLKLNLDVSAADRCELRLGRATCHVSVSFAAGLMTVDRSTARYPDSSDVRRQVRILRLPEGDQIDLLVVHDRSVTELFLADGELVFSLRSFLEPDAFQVTLTATGTVTVTDAEATPIG